MAALPLVPKVFGVVKRSATPARKLKKTFSPRRIWPGVNSDMLLKREKKRLAEEISRRFVPGWMHTKVLLRSP